MSDYIVEQKHKALFERQEPTFYSKMPKMAIMDLTPYELALYANYKQTAGENGGSWKSNKTLAKETKMSVRMVQECRKSLEEKGFIKCAYETNGNGTIVSSVIVTIVDIWAENHKRYTPAHDAPPMQEVHTPHAGGAYPPAHDAPKEEPYKKNQKNNPLLEEMKSLVKKELKQYKASSANKMAMLLLGLCTGKDAELNLLTPLSAQDFHLFLADWDKKVDRTGNRLTRPRNIESLKNAVEDWQSKQKTTVAAAPLPAVSVANVIYQVETPISESDQQSVLALIQASKKELHHE